MAAARGNEPAVEHPGSSALTVQHRLYEPEGACAFDFFQAIRMLTTLAAADRAHVGMDGPPQAEMVRFHAHVSLSFPASAIQQLTPATAGEPAQMTVNFMGLTGPSGVLPRHYTERLWADLRGDDERYALRDWLDLFNHRLVSLFYRAWEKYRFYLPFERGEWSQRDPDAFSRCLFSTIGLGFRSYRNRFRVTFAEHPAPAEGPARIAPRDKELLRLNDSAFLRFAGLFAHWPRCAVSLEAFLRVYLELPVEVRQFQGQWLQLGRDSQTSVGMANARLGQDSLVGDRIWDVQSKIRIRIGPLKYDDFLELLPDPSRLARRKRIFLLAQVVRYYLGAELDFEFQLVLDRDSVPTAQAGPHSRLGWNTWCRRQPYPRHAEDTVFTVADGIRVNGTQG